MYISLLPYGDHMPHPSHHALHWQQYKSWSCSLHSFLQAPVTSFQAQISSPHELRLKRKQVKFPQYFVRPRRKIWKRNISVTPNINLAGQWKAYNAETHARCICTTMGRYAVCWKFKLSVVTLWVSCMYNLSLLLAWLLLCLMTALNVAAVLMSVAHRWLMPSIEISIHSGESRFCLSTC